MNRAQLTKMLLGFMMLKAHGPRYLKEGICHNVDTVLLDLGCTYLSCDSEYNVLTFYRHQLEIVAKWPEYSGTTSYPICTGSRQGSMPGYIEYISARGTATQWADTDYGDARRRLLDFIIVTLQEQLRDYPNGVLPDQCEITAHNSPEYFS